MQVVLRQISVEMDGLPILRTKEHQICVVVKLHKSIELNGNNVVHFNRNNILINVPTSSHICTYISVNSNI